MNAKPARLSPVPLKTSQSGRRIRPLIGPSPLRFSGGKFRR
jgi:hypothetical protein